MKPIFNIFNALLMCFMLTISMMWLPLLFGFIFFGISVLFNMGHYLNDFLIGSIIGTLVQLGIMFIF
jgi:hypothetical protein